MTYSLRKRILAGSALACAVALLLVGSLLTIAFQKYIQDRFDSTLQLGLHDLVAAMTTNNQGDLQLSWRPSNPLFNAPVSGWYWIIHDEDSRLLAASDSLINDPARWLIQASIEDSNNQWFEVDGPGNHPLRAHSRVIRPGNQETGYRVIVTGPLDDISQDVREFIVILLLLLGIVTMGFVAILWYQIRVTLAPLNAARDTISAIRTGQKTRLDVDLPIELKPLSNEINALLEDNETIISRARLQASNLAHALKNPLTIIRNENSGSDGEKTRSQVDKLSALIKRYLSRVRIAGALNSSRAVTKIRPVVEDIQYSLQQIYHDQKLEFRIKCPDTLETAVEQQDLEEILGNLLDNACKWAMSSVSLSASIDGRFVALTIQDDGPGFPANQSGQIFKPGQRLDESIDGQGLGLSIVADIVTSYDGEIYIDEQHGHTSGITVLLPHPQTNIH